MSGIQDLLAMIRREVEELRETVERLKREKEEVPGSLEEVVRERDRLARELLQVVANNKTLSNIGKSARYYRRRRRGTGWPRSSSRSGQGTRH